MVFPGRCIYTVRPVPDPCNTPLRRSFIMPSNQLCREFDQLTLRRTR